MPFYFRAEAPDDDDDEVETTLQIEPDGACREDVYHDMPAREGEPLIELATIAHDDAPPLLAPADYSWGHANAPWTLSAGVDGSITIMRGVMALFLGNSAPCLLAALHGFLTMLTLTH